MDQMPRADDGIANGDLFGDSQQFTGNYDNLFPTGNDQTFDDASWGLNASGYPSLSRAPSSQATPSWAQNTTHLSNSNTPNSFNTANGIYGRSPVHSPAPFAQNNAYGGYPGQQYNYGQPYRPVAQQHVNPGFQAYGHTPVNSATIAPQALAPGPQYAGARQPNDRLSGDIKYGSPAQQPVQAQNTPSLNQNALIQSIPAGEQHGRFSTIDFSQLVKATNAERLAMFAGVGKQPQEFPVNRSTALPAYYKRHSRNELKAMAKNDPKLISKLTSKPLDRAGAFTQRVGQAANTGSPGQAAGNIKYEGDSDSDSDSSESDVSLYSDEEDDLAGAPLPSKRPDEDPKQAVEYDTIKALWRNKRKTIDATSIRKGLGDFWEIVKTIRDRWKDDTNAVTDAEKKGKVGDLALLKSRVRDQRDMLEVAFRTALKHGFRPIIELFSENAPFLYLCYQFLLDRNKVEDWNSPLPRAILETLTLTTSITDEKLEKTHLQKILPRYLKSGDGKTKFYTRKITDTAAANSKNQPAKKEPEAAAGVKRSSTTAGNTNAATAPKKLATSGATASGASSSAKPATSAATKPASTATTKTAAGLKKPGPGSSTNAAKPATTTAAPPAKTKTVTAKPSSFFSGLQSAGKKPGTSNAERIIPKPADRKPATGGAPAKPAFDLAATLAGIKNKAEEKPKEPTPKPDSRRDSEPPERKAKRAARLARGAAGVRWKEPSDLVEVRYFTHDPEEEIDHNASQMRDVKDIGGEGRMLKQHKDMMDVDEEEDSGDDESKLVAFRTPSAVDFSNMVTDEGDERDRNYAPYGGGRLQPESPESEARKQYEANTLIAIYSTPSDIPPDPREPTDPENGEQPGAIKTFGAPPEKYVQRAVKKGQQKAANAFKTGQQQGFPPQPPQGLDLSALASFMGKQTQQPPQMQQPQAQAAGTPNIQEILKQLSAGGAMPPAQQAQPAAPPMQNPPFPGFGGPAPFNFGAPPQPASQPQRNEPDISAILAALQGNNNNASASGPPPAMPPFGNFPFPFPPMPQQQPPQTYSNNNNNNNGGGGGGGEVSKKRADNPYYKTKVCKYWQEDKCRKGAECSYLHE